MARRRDNFPIDRGLEARMLVAVLVQAAILAAYVAACVWLTLESTPWVLFFIGLFLAGGLAAGAAVDAREGGEPDDRARADGLVTRLSHVADIEPPDLRIRSRAAPLSWTTSAFGKRRVYVTTGLLRTVDDPELEAVLAHEIGHLINHDAVVMTTLVGPPVAMLRGLQTMWNDPDETFKKRVAVLTYGVLVAPLAFLGTITGRIISRHRELAADRAAAVLTGSPARVQAALLAVSDGLHRIPQRDLRAVAAGDPFHFVPVKPAKGIGRLWATHPPLDDRLQRLAAMEARLQGKSAFTQS